MSLQASQFPKSLTAIHPHLITAKALGHDYLLRLFTKNDIRDLTPRVPALHHLLFVHVPKPETTVGRPRPGGQQIIPDGAPGQGLHRRLMSLPEQRDVHFGGEDVQLVVIAPRSEVIPIGGPLDPTDLLFVGLVGLDQAFFLAKVVEEDGVVPGPREQEILEEGEGADPFEVVVEPGDAFVVFMHVKHLHLSLQVPCREQGPIFLPGDP